MMTCSLIVKGPGLSGIPKTEIFGRYRAQAMQIGKLNSCGTSLSCRIRFSNWDLKGENETPWGNLFTNLTDTDGRVSKREELVHAGKDDSPNKTDDPSPESRRWHLGIIYISNRSTDFWIWGFILKDRCCRVKIWVVVVVDSNVLSVSDQVCQQFLLSI